MLDFARGPGLQWSLTIMIVGLCWRIVGVFLGRWRRDLSRPRSDALVQGGLRAIITRSAPARELEKNIRFQHYTGYVWHIAFFVTVLFYQPHIAFFKSVLGFGWPGLPSHVVVIPASIALAILVTLMIRRIIHPVMRVISTPGDYLSLIIIISALVTGLMAYAHMGPRYETMLGLHIVNVELLLIWIPFSKLVHMVFWLLSRYRIGTFFERKGVRA
ncbi:MAG: nitrate reductase [Desulfobulbaceae bacterium]|nr:nitrate reductase [Desulfobulbaceae bacterium]